MLYKLIIKYNHNNEKAESASIRFIQSNDELLNITVLEGSDLAKVADLVVTALNFYVETAIDDFLPLIKDLKKIPKLD